MDYAAIPVGDVPYMREAMRRAHGQSTITSPSENIKGYDNRNHGIVFVKNTTGAVINPGDALTLGDPVEPDAEFLKGRIVFETDTFDPTQRVVVAQTLIPANESGPAVISGTAMVNLDIVNASDSTCGPKTQSEFESGNGDYPIVWKELGTGVKKAVILLPVSSGGAKVIMFQPLGVASGHGFTCDVCLCRVVTADCSSGVQIGDEVVVWDIAPRFDLSPNGFFRMPEDLLVRSFGFATWMKTHEAEYDRPADLGNCRWVVTNMMCVEPNSYS